MCPVSCTVCPNHGTTTTCPSCTSCTSSTPLPYTVQHHERCGRLLVAARAVTAGEEIFVDRPAAMGPDNNPRPVCLVCYTRLSGRPVAWCRGCGWPLCSHQCQENVGLHYRECQMFQTHSTRYDTCSRHTLLGMTHVPDTQY